MYSESTRIIKLVRESKAEELKLLLDAGMIKPKYHNIIAMKFTELGGIGLKNNIESDLSDLLDNWRLFEPDEYVAKNNLVHEILEKIMEGRTSNV